MVNREVAYLRLVGSFVNGIQAMRFAGGMGGESIVVACIFRLVVLRDGLMEGCSIDFFFILFGKNVDVLRFDSKNN